MRFAAFTGERAFGPCTACKGLGQPGQLGSGTSLNSRQLGTPHTKINIRKCHENSMFLSEPERRESTLSAPLSPFYKLSRCTKSRSTAITETLNPQDSKPMKSSIPSTNSRTQSQKRPASRSSRRLAANSSAWSTLADCLSPLGHFFPVSRPEPCLTLEGQESHAPPQAVNKLAQKRQPDRIP